MDNTEEVAEVEHQVTVDQPVAPDDEPLPQRRNWLEVLVDPQTLRGLMLSGGGLLVLGLVVWLWSIGLFANKRVVASCLGAANIALLAVGVSGARYSRYQTASKAITMLACLVMPLNLWFYDAQGLITLDQGGHLWVPALVCCALYVLVARVLADPLFVSAIVGGVTMTGLLWLADNQVGRLWEVMAPSTFLVVLGILCIHVERAFPPEQGPYSRENFGRAFFRAGHVVMGLGLTVLLVGRLTGRLYEPLLADWGWFAMPEVATQANLKLLALSLALGAVYAYVYSQLVVEAKGRYFAASLLTLLWAAVLLLDWLQIPFTMELVMLLTSIGALLASFAATIRRPRDQAAGGSDRFAELVNPLRNVAGKLAVGLNLATLGLGLVLYTRARVSLVHASMPYEFEWQFLLAALLAGSSCWFTARLGRRSTPQATAVWPPQLGIVFGWLALEATIASFGFEYSVVTLAFEMIVPLTFAIVSLQVSDRSIQRQSALAAERLAALLLVVSGGVAVGLIAMTLQTQPHFWPTIFFAEAAICFGLVCRPNSSAEKSRLTPAVLAAVSSCAAIWQLLLLMGVTQYVFLLATTSFGLACLAVGSFRRPADGSASKLALVSQWTGRLSISYSSVATLLIALARWLSSETAWPLFGMLVVQALATAIAGLLAKQSGWRRHFWVLAVGEVILTLLVVNSLSMFSLLQRGELLLTVAGLIVLAIGFWGWYRETDQREDLVSCNLALGSLLSAAPLTLGMLVQRFDDSLAEWGWVLVHEAGVLSIGLLLLGTGVLCRIRWSTIVGGSTLIIYVVSLIGLVRLPEQLQSTAIMMMIGGGLFFGTAVILSIYRDRLLAIPQRVQAGEGVFRVLKWR